MAKKTKEEIAESRRLYREAHKEDRKAYGEAYYAANKEDKKAYGKEYYASNKEDREAYGEAYHNTHREEILLSKKNNRANLTDSYVREALNLTKSQATPELIELKRMHLTINRSLREIKNVTTNKQD